MSTSPTITTTSTATSTSQDRAPSPGGSSASRFHLAVQQLSSLEQEPSLHQRVMPVPGLQVTPPTSPLGERQIRSERPRTSRGGQTSRHEPKTIKRHRTTGEEPHLFTIEVPLASWVDRLGVRVISHKEWDATLYREFRNKVLVSDLSSDSRSKIVRNCYRESLCHSSILMRIAAAVKVLKGLHPFLDDFCTEVHPLHFLKKWDKLNAQSSEKGNILFYIMGREKAEKIIRTAAAEEGRVLKEKLHAEFDKLASVALKSAVELKRRELLQSSFVFQKNFDVDNPHIVPIPIFLFDYKEVIESFRAYCSGGVLPADTIVINGQNVSIPDQKQVQAEDRERAFLHWLLAELQKGLGVTATLNEKTQLDLFASGELDLSLSKEQKRTNDARLKKAIERAFKNGFGGDFEKTEVFLKLTAVLSTLGSQEGTEEFAQALLPHCVYVSKYLCSLPAFQQKAWGDVSHALLGIYRRVYQLQTKYKKIPLLSVLKAMCFSGYRIVDIFLRGTLCPQLIQGKLQRDLYAAFPMLHSQDSRESMESSRSLTTTTTSTDASSTPSEALPQACPYQLKLDHHFITSYRITRSDKFFEVIHIKAFDIVFANAHKAKMVVHWTVQGQFGSLDYSSAVEIAALDFDPDCPNEEQKIIVDQFHWDWSSTPWGHYLKREKVAP